MTALLLLSNHETTRTSFDRDQHHEASSSSAARNGKISAHDDDKEYMDDDESTPYTNVFFRYMDGKTYCLWLDPSNVTVLQVKSMLVEHVQKCILFVSSSSSRDDETNQCTTPRSPALLLLETSKQQSIEDIREDTYSLCSPTSTSLATGNVRGTAAAASLCMVWQGKPLEDDAVLSHYIQQQGSNQTALTTIVVWQRQRGGCFMVSLSILVIIFFALMGSCCTCGLSLLVVPVLLPLLFILPLFCL